MGRMRSVKAKKKCCQNTPRCKSCPIVLRRLANAGLAAREGKRIFTFDGKIPKKALKKARTP